ncbi:MAG: metallophosphoesterase [Rhodomicrobium sp.]|nr:metallophosphoesterase [Rhodomicrobium sp.]
MFQLAHLSDIHLAPLPRPALHELFSKRAFGYLNWQRRRFKHRREVLDRLVEDMLAHRPDHIAMTGDLVNIALPREFLQARHWLDSVGSPESITVIPGNHDAYVPFFRNPAIRHWQPYMAANEGGERFSDAGGLSFPFVRLLGKIALICLSSARPTPPGLASGWLGPRQIRRTGAILDQLKQEGYFRAVLIHHPPLPGLTSWQRALHDAGSFRRMLVRHGAELVLHGHNHRAMLARLDTATGPVPIVGAPSASFVSDQPAKYARYNLISIAEANSGWRIGMRGRIFNGTGHPTEVHQDLLP